MNLNEESSVLILYYCLLFADSESKFLILHGTSQYNVKNSSKSQDSRKPPKVLILDLFLKRIFVEEKEIALVVADELLNSQFDCSQSGRLGICSANCLWRLQKCEES